MRLSQCFCTAKSGSARFEGHMIEAGEDVTFLEGGTCLPGALAADTLDALRIMLRVELTRPDQASCSRRMRSRAGTRRTAMGPGCGDAQIRTDAASRPSCLLEPHG